MEVHLVRSEEVDLKLVGDVLDILRSVPGPISFCANVDNAINILEEDTEIEILEEEEFGKIKADCESENCCSLAIEYDFPLRRNTITWRSLFKKAAEYRKENKIPADEFVLLLTDIANEKNWFSMLDNRNPLNGLIHM